MKTALFCRNSLCDNELLFGYCIAFFEIAYYIEIEFI